jgi:malonyl-CoA/methylmalonyl-CoA synthetase
MQQSFFSLVQQHYPRDLGKLFIETEDGREISYHDLETASGRCAAYLTRLGAVRGDRVAFQVEKSPEAIFLYLGCLRAGLIALPMNPAYGPSEVEYMLGNAEPRIFVCDPAREAALTAVAGRAGVAHIGTLDGDGQGSVASACHAIRDELPPVEMAADEPAAMLYTSGTTGRPKGAPLTHGNLASNAEVLAEAWGFTEHDVLLHALPIFHAHGLFVALHCTLMAGASMLWLKRFEALKVIKLLDRANVLMGVPTFYTRMLDIPSFGIDDASHMRLFISGSAPLLSETHREFEARTGQVILERYGMSEILMHTSNPLRGERRAGTVGPPLPGSSVRIVDVEDRELSTGRIGHVLVKGPNVFKGYWRLPEKNAEEFTEDGWFRTGDLGTMDEGGYLTLVGRGKDLVITGGLNVYPAEVEAVIDEQGGVLESAVIGLPHRDLGEGVTAVVVRAAGVPPIAEAAVIGACKARLAGFKVPKRVLFVSELPRNAMGKVQKKLLRDEYAELYSRNRG